MKRREFIALLAGTAATGRWPRVRSNPQAGLPGGYSAIGRGATLHFIKASKRPAGPRLPYCENVIIEYRFANGEMERLPANAADVVRLGVDTIVATGTNHYGCGHEANHNHPIVMITGLDPVSGRACRQSGAPRR